jgi:hypothetical protein
MGTIEVLRKEVLDSSGGTLVGRSPALPLLGGVDLPQLGLSRLYLAALDLVLYQQSGLDFVPVPDALRSRLLEAPVTTPGGGLLGSVEDFQDPLQPIIVPLVRISPNVWPPPATIPLWQQVVAQEEITPGLAVTLLLPVQEVNGTITDPPAHLPYFGPSFQALAAQAQFPGSLNHLMHGAPVVRRDERNALVGMLIGAQAATGGTLTNIFPLAAVREGGTS